MKQFTTIILGVFALVALAGGSAAAQSQAVTIKLNELHGSGDFGTATLTAVGPNQVRVVIQMGGAMPMDHNHPAHIHQGTCATLNPTPAFPLNPVTSGQSTTIVPVSLTALLASRYAINLHESPAAITTYTACGEITTLNAVGTPPPAAAGSMGGTGSAGTTMGGSGSMAGGASALPATGNGTGLFLGSALLLTALLLTSLGLLLRRARAT